MAEPAETKQLEKLLEQVPTPVLLKLARERNQQAREEAGPYGAQKHLSPCPGCEKPQGVREMRRHKRTCKEYKKLAKGKKK